MRRKSVLIVEDDEEYAETVLGYRFKEMGYAVRIVSDLKSARNELAIQVYSIVTVDMHLEGDGKTVGGELVLAFIRDHCGQVPCIVISGSDLKASRSFKMARKYPMVVDYIDKESLTYERLKELVDQACRAKEDTRTSDDVEASIQPAGVASEERTPRRRCSTKLRQILDMRFDEGELRTLCSDLGIDYDDLPAVGRANKARELVNYLDRHDRISELVEIGKELRPDVPWGEML